jgi:hypothetical protein
MSEPKVDDTKPNETKPKVVGRSIAIALGIICIVLLAGLIGLFGTINDKNAQISSLNAQIYQLNSNVTNLQSNVSRLNSTVLQQQSQLNELGSLKNLTDQIFSLHPKPYDSSVGWLGSWNLVATFDQNAVSGGKTPNFQISSQFGLWRFNYTVQQNLWFNIIQVVGSQTIVTAEFQATNTGEIDHGSVYYFQYSVTSPLTYYIEFPTGSFAGNWRMTVEELDLSI